MAPYGTARKIENTLGFAIDSGNLPDVKVGHYTSNETCKLLILKIFSKIGEIISEIPVKATGRSIMAKRIKSCKIDPKKIHLQAYIERFRLGAGVSGTL